MDAVLIEFAKFVLQTMEETEEWNAEMLDEVADKARCLELADLDHEGMFFAFDFTPVCDCQRSNGPHAVCRCNSPEGWS